VTWQRAKLKFIARFGYCDALPTNEVQEGLFRVFGSNGPYASFSRPNTGTPAIIVGRKGSYGKVNWTSEPCFASDTTFFIDSSTTCHDLRWVYWLLQTLHLDEGTDEAAVPGLNRESAYDKEMIYPPRQLQRAIAAYLDRETARLDGLVASKERVLGLLAEKRRALIARAVTRGIDPCVPLRDSGIPWLGEIPAHWELIPLRFLVDIVGGATPDTGKAEFWDGDIPWVSPKDMKRDEIKDAEDHVSTLALSSSALRLIAPVVVLIVVRGMILAHSFPTAVTTQPVTINQDMKALRCRELIEPRYLRDFLRGLEAQLVSIAEESAHGTRKLESEVLGRFQVCVPPIDEQRAIVAHITAETAKLEALRAATERTIALLKERRTALIAAAVTGRLHIPEAA
jgi:type I restriction enzyme S subunit